MRVSDREEKVWGTAGVSEGATKHMTAVPYRGDSGVTRIGRNAAAVNLGITLLAANDCTNSIIGTPRAASPSGKCHGEADMLTADAPSEHPPRGSRDHQKGSTW